MNWATLKQAIIDWAQAQAPGCTVVLSDQAAPQAALPFVQLGVLALGGEVFDRAQSFDPGAQVWERTEGESEGSVTMDAAARAAASSPAALALQPLDLTVYDGPTYVGSVRDGDESLALTLTEGELNFAEQWPQLAGVRVSVAELEEGDAFRLEAEHLHEEILFTVETPSDLTLSIQVHAADAFAAVALAKSLKGSLNLEGVRAALYSAGASVLDCGTIKSVGKLVDAGAKGIAVFEPRLGVKDVASERTGYIAKVTVKPTTQSPGKDPVEGTPFDVDLE